MKIFSLVMMIGGVLTSIIILVSSFNESKIEDYDNGAWWFEEDK